MFLFIDFFLLFVHLIRESLPLLIHFTLEIRLAGSALVLDVELDFGLSLVYQGLIKSTALQQVQCLSLVKRQF